MPEHTKSTRVQITIETNKRTIEHDLDHIPGIETVKASHRIHTGEEIDNDTALEILLRDTPEDYD